MNQEGTKRTIVDTTLQLLAREGFQAITTRRIAEEANVNVAAVNYHFGSKDALISEAVALFRAKTRDLFTVLADSEMPMEHRLVELIHRFADHVVAYPGFLKTFIAAIAHGREPPEAAQESILRSRELMFTHLRVVLNTNDEDIRNKMIQLMSAIVYPAILGEHAEKLYKIPFDNAEYRRRYIDQLIETFGLQTAREE